MGTGACGAGFAAHATCAESTIKARKNPVRKKLICRKIRLRESFKYIPEVLMRNASGNQGLGQLPYFAFVKLRPNEDQSSGDFSSGFQG